MPKKPKKIESVGDFPDSLSYRLSIFFINCPAPIRITFEGSNDSGQLDSFEIHATEEHQTEKNKAMLESLDQELTNYAGTLLEHSQPGWEINEGSSGSITMYPNGAIVLTVDERITTINTQDYFDTWNGITTEPPEE